jgi:CheY-like chemotaxis protein
MKRILIVEDDFILSLVNKKNLQLMGHTIVACVTNGPAAIEAVKIYKPDVILMDIRLDGEMNGIEAMRKISLFSDVPAIYLTGNSDEESRGQAATTNMIGFCVKPIHFGQLEAILKKM